MNTFTRPPSEKWRAKEKEKDNKLQNNNNNNDNNDMIYKVRKHKNEMRANGIQKARHEQM